jgi:Ni/Co efflux regulator RcnB
METRGPMPMTHSMPAHQPAPPAVVVRHHGGGQAAAHGANRVIVRRHGGGDMRMGGHHRNRNYSGYHRIDRGFVLPQAWWGPRYGISNWSAYGLPQPIHGGRWVRYYDDALMIDSYGRVHDGRWGMSWDDRDDRWSYDDRGAPYRGGDDDYYDEDYYEDDATAAMPTTAAAMATNAVTIGAIPTARLARRAARRTPEPMGSITAMATATAMATGAAWS